jgi:hypothetical protein
MRPIGGNLSDLVSRPGSSTSACPHPVHLGRLLENNLRKSLAWKKSQRQVAALMSGAFSATTVDGWRKMREAFDLDQTNPDPYEEVEHRE